MENAVDALRIILAILIFSIGLMLLFSMAGQARETARIMIAETDPTKYYDYYNYIEEINETTVDANGNRIVELQDIIPALYRYSQENYGVTIVNKAGEIVARFDLDTERICNDWLGLNEKTADNLSIIGQERIERFIEETKDTYRKANKLAVEINKNTIDVDIDKDKIVELFRKIYGQDTSSSNINRTYYCYWIGNTGWTAQRIDSDLSRNKCTF